MLRFMAKKLKEYEFRQGARNRYPWTKWLDGEIWVLKMDEDFKVAPYTFRAIAYVAAKRKGMRLRTELRDTEVVIQAYAE